jgi:hypothetical protein
MASPQQSVQADALNQIFQGLKNRSSEVRLQSAVELKRYVSCVPYKRGVDTESYHTGGENHPRDVFGYCDEDLGRQHKQKTIRAHA